MHGAYRGVPVNIPSTQAATSSPAARYVLYTIRQGPSRYGAPTSIRVGHVQGQPRRRMPTVVRGVPPPPVPRPRGGPLPASQERSCPYPGRGARGHGHGHVSGLCACSWSCSGGPKTGKGRHQAGTEIGTDYQLVSASTGWGVGGRVDMPRRVLATSHPGAQPTREPQQGTLRQGPALHQLRLLQTSYDP